MSSSLIPGLSDSPTVLECVTESQSPHENCGECIEEGLTPGVTTPREGLVFIVLGGETCSEGD